MPTLPTLTVTDAQQARILEAFKAIFGTTTTAETVTAYKQWLAEIVKGQVIAYENEKFQKTNTVSAEVEAALKGMS